MVRNVENLPYQQIMRGAFAYLLSGKKTEGTPTKNCKIRNVVNNVYAELTSKLAILQLE